VSNVITHQVSRFAVLEDSNFSLMWRLYGADAALITQASLSSITFTVWDLEATDPSSSTASGTLTVSSVVHDTLQTDDRWTADVVGYNFRHDVAATICTTGGHSYRFEYVFTASGGEVFHLVAIVTAQQIMTS
jgi:hypothetical protein